MPRLAFKMIAVGLGVAIPVVGFLLAEVTLRFLNPEEVGYSRADPETRWSLQPGFNGPGPDLPGVKLTYPVRINEAGFRGPLVEKNKPNGVVRLVSLGDSVTFGFGVREEETFTAVAAEELSHDTLPNRIEWVNAGVPGFSSAQGLSHLRSRVLALAPDVVTVFFAWNDGWRTAVPDKERTQPGGLQAILDSSRVFEFSGKAMNSIARRIGIGGAPPPVQATKARVPVPEFEQNLLAISEAIRRAGAVPVFITAPAAFGPDRPPDSYFHFGWTVPRAELEPTRLRYADAVRRVAAAHGIAVVDCAQLVPPDSNIFLEDGYHPNKAGHRAIAEQIVAVIRNGHLLSAQSHSSAR